MHRRKFVTITVSTVLAAAATGYLLSDKSNVTRADISEEPQATIPLQADEKAILYLASLAPSGHNTQPWSVRYIQPYHWIICNEKNRWLPAVDPHQRETILSIGAFLQNLEYAAASFGYTVDINLLAATNQDQDLVELRLIKSGLHTDFDISTIKLRRTVRSHYLNVPLKAEDLHYITGVDTDFAHFIAPGSKQYQWLNEATVTANQIQSYRDDAEGELAEWIRFSANAASQHYDGLTPASMEIQGLPGWVVRNFYTKADVMKKSFREQSIEKVKAQVAVSGGWLLLSSKDSSVASLLESGKRLQRILLKVRSRNIAIHPMTQILEEATVNEQLKSVIALTDPVQFILRAGYIRDYPTPVSLRRPVAWFVRPAELV